MPFTGSPFSCLMCRTGAVMKTAVLLCALVAKNVLCLSILRRPFIYLCSVFLKNKTRVQVFWTFLDIATSLHFAHFALSQALPVPISYVQRSCALRTCLPAGEQHSLALREGCFPRLWGNSSPHCHPHLPSSFGDEATALFRAKLIPF